MGGEERRILLLSFASVNFMYSRTSALQKEYNTLKKSIKSLFLVFFLWS